MELLQELQKKQEMIENALSDYVPATENEQGTIYRAMRYSLLAGGKRLRPVIMLLACELCGGRAEDALPFACALEMIHTYSLIHDDLPAMDNDDLRRGKPTNHIQFGEAMAILAGDGLLNKAFEITADSKTVPAEVAIRAISVLANASGTEGMIGGQVVDIENEEKSLTMNQLQYLHSLKTGAIIRAAGVVGAIVAGADAEKVKALDDYCLNLGIAFQIRDDILDVVGTEQDLGKPIGSDAQNQKTTYLTLCSLEEAESLVGAFTEKAIRALDSFGEKKEILISLARYLLDRKN